MSLLDFFQLVRDLSLLSSLTPYFLYFLPPRPFTNVLSKPYDLIFMEDRSQHNWQAWQLTQNLLFWNRAYKHIQPWTTGLQSTTTEENCGKQHSTQCYQWKTVVDFRLTGLLHSGSVCMVCMKEKQELYPGSCCDSSNRSLQRTWRKRVM